MIEAEESYIGLILQTTTNHQISLTAQFLCNNRGGFSLVPRPHPAFRHLQYRKAGRGLGTRLGWIIMRTIQFSNATVLMVPTSAVESLSRANSVLAEV